MGDIHYQIVVFCAAITSVEECEKNPNKAYKINFENTFKLAQNFIKNKSFVVFFSTSQVFSGSNKIELIQNEPKPFTIYGKTKANLEKALIPYYKNVCILRCTKIIFKSNSLFLGWINNLKSDNQINPFYDVHFSPVSIDYLLVLLKEIMKFRMTGLYNVSSQTDITFEEASYYLANKMCLNSNLICPISSKSVNSLFIPQFTNIENTLLEICPAPSPLDALDYFISKYHIDE